MENISYSHNEVIKICELPARRVIHWTQSGLIEARVEASGAGTKREYSYTNLLEFGLCKELFDIGIGVQSVKKILKELREDGDLRNWSEDFKGYLEKIASEFRGWFTLKQKEFPVPPSLTDEQPFLWFLKTEDFLKNIKPDTHTGILFYCYNTKGQRFKVIMPFGLRKAIEAAYSYKEMWQSLKILIIDIGMIKLKIDHKIMLVV